MLRLVKQIVWLLGFIIGCQSAFGFALLGPVPAGGNPDDYQIPGIGYALGTFGIANGANVVVSDIAGYPGDDIGTPKSIGEGYRRNTPVLYYSFDAAFLNFFGTDGAAEVDKAMAIYNSLTNVSSYSPELSEFPLDSRRVNFRAAAASLLDIKSVTMGLMTEQLGFWQPVRWVWALHARVHLTGFPSCPAGMEYTIDKKNLDILSSDPSNYQYSSYVNGVLYSYFILDGCNTAPLIADAIEFPVDPLASPYSAVADFDSLEYTGLTAGEFYTSLTRDDVGGLRYLIREKNRPFETGGKRTIEFLTNNTTIVVSTLDLSLFAAQARTNDAATLTTLYPGLVVTASTNFFGLVITTNISEILVNSPFDPAGTLPSHPLFTTNYSTNFFSFFLHSFGNLVTNTFASRGLVSSLTLGLSVSPTSPAGTLPTVTTNVKSSFVNGVFGDFFLLPTNFCGAQILSNWLTTVIATTNFPTIVATGATNGGVTFVPGSVTYFTNHAVAYLPVTCPVDPPGHFGGMEKVRFIRRDYDFLVGQAWDPVTNDYTLMELVSSNIVVPRHMQRAVPRPDFLFTVTDLAANTGFTYSNTVDGANQTLTVGITGIGKFDVVRTINFNEDARPSGQAGPGTIEGPLDLPTLMIYNKIGPLYFNSAALFLTNAEPFFFGEQTQVPLFDLSWGSFDGSTNAPEVYPNGSSIVDLENILTGPTVITTFLPNANVGANYSTQLVAAGGQGPYAWSLAPGSAGLPGGLNISPSGLISGTPAGPAAIYDFTVRVADQAGAFKDVAFTITVF